MNFNCRYTKYNRRYQYKGFWIDISLNTSFQQKDFWYEVKIELPNQQGVISDYPYPSLDQAEEAATSLIDSWN